MTESIPIIVLPYLTSIIVKVAGLVADPQVMSSALSGMDSGSEHYLSNAQQRVIVRHILHATLKSSAVVTTFTSLLAAIIVVLEKPTDRWLSWLLLFFVGIAAILLAWILPKKVHYFGSRGFYGVKREVWAVLSFCSFDVVLAITSLLAVSHRVPPTP